MTEEKAKTKWCPFARVDSNRTDCHGFQVSADPCCIGSACMAWRVTKDPTLNWHGEERQIHQEQHGQFVPGGYCGLAGRPE